MADADYLLDLDAIDWNPVKMTNAMERADTSWCAAGTWHQSGKVRLLDTVLDSGFDAWVNSAFDFRLQRRERDGKPVWLFAEDSLSANGLRHIVATRGRLDDAPYIAMYMNIFGKPPM
jgi:hypothetical protein